MDISCALAGHVTRTHNVDALGLPGLLLSTPEPSFPLVLVVPHGLADHSQSAALHQPRELRMVSGARHEWRHCRAMPHSLPLLAACLPALVLILCHISRSLGQDGFVHLGVSNVSHRILKMAQNTTRSWHPEPPEGEARVGAPKREGGGVRHLERNPGVQGTEREGCKVARVVRGGRAT